MITRELKSIFHQIQQVSSISFNTYGEVAKDQQMKQKLETTLRIDPQVFVFICLLSYVYDLTLKRNIDVCVVCMIKHDALHTKLRVC